MSELAIQLCDCSYEYDANIPALRGINCGVPAGRWVALVGQNGSGKSTLAKLCNGLLRPQGGQVRVLGQDIAGQPVGQIARKVGYLFQNPDHQIFASSVREELAFGPRNLGFRPGEIAERVEEAMALFDLGPYAEQPPAMLGYGLRRQVTVASLFALRPHILILDEPTAGLDWASTQRLLNRLRELNRTGHTILVITHDMRLVAEQAERVLVLHQGRLLAQGSPREVFVQSDMLRLASLGPPPVTCLAQRLHTVGMRGDSLTVQEFHQEFAALKAGAGP